MDSKKRHDVGVEVGPPRGNRVHGHHAAALLKITDTLDGESLPSLGTVLIAGTDQFDSGSQARERATARIQESSLGSLRPQRRLCWNAYGSLPRCLRHPHLWRVAFGSGLAPPRRELRGFIDAC